MLGTLLRHSWSFFQNNVFNSTEFPSLALLKGLWIYALSLWALRVHSLKIVRLVAHDWKKLNFSMGILTFLAVPNEFWKGKGSSWSSVSQLLYEMGQIWSIKIRAQFPCFLDICKLWGYFRHQIMLNQLIKHSDS